MPTWPGLRARLVLLVLLSLLPAGAWLVYSALQQRSSALEQAGARLQSQVRLVAAHQQRLLEKASDVLLGMVHMPAIGEIVPALCGPYLARLQARHPEIEQLGLLGLNGRSLCASASPADVQDASEADFFRQVLAGQPLAVGAYREGAAGLIVGRPLHDRLGQLAGVAFATVPVQELAGAFGRAVLQPGTAAALLDADARVLAATPSAPAGLGRPHPQAVVLQAVQALRQPELAFEHAQTSAHMYAFAPVPMPGTGSAALLVALERPRALVAADSRPAIGAQLLALLAVVLGGLGCAWWVGHRLIVRPARAVLRAADEIGQGRPASRVGLDTGRTDEIGQIGQAVNRMAETLDARQGALDAALRESERERALLGLVLNSMSEGVMAIDTDSRVLLFNDCAARIHEARPEIGSSMAEWRHDHELLRLDGQTPCPVPERPLIQALRGISLDNQDLLLRSAGRPDRVLRMSTRPLYDAQAALIGGVAVFHDITESRRAEQALAATNRALQMLSRSCIAINRIGEEERLLAEVCRVAVEVGGYCMAWVGYARDDEKKSVVPVAHAGDESGYLDSIEISWDADHPSGQGPSGQAIRSSQPAQRSNIGADSSYLWQANALQRGYRSSIALPLCDEAGHSFGVLSLYRGEVEFFTPDEVRLLQELADNLAFGIGSLRARQERLRSQEAAREAALRLAEQAALLDHAQDAIIVRNPDATVRFWNQGAQRLYGWSAADVLGRTMAAQMYRHPQQLAEAMAQMLDKGGDWTGEVEQLAQGGAVVHVESRCTVVRDEQGRVTGVLSINTDIGERRRAHAAILSLNASLEERVRQRTAELELANQQLESFSYSVSHDLRSPLNAIGGFSQLLEKNLAAQAAQAGSELLATRSAHYLARIRAGVMQMSELIDAMLSLAQVSRSDLRWESVDLGALAQGLLTGYQEREPGREARWQVEPALVVQGDARLLKQVLDNLLGNAWKFSAGQACTEIALSRETGPDGAAVYVVRDNGAGFDMAYADKLFCPFQRLHAQSEFAGTGIGLATVARVIERHGGRIWAESAPGEGARFYFTLGAQAG